MEKDGGRRYGRVKAKGPLKNPQQNEIEKPKEQKQTLKHRYVKFSPKTKPEDMHMKVMLDLSVASLYLDY